MTTADLSSSLVPLTSQNKQNGEDGSIASLLVQTFLKGTCSKPCSDHNSITSSGSYSEDGSVNTEAENDGLVGDCGHKGLLVTERTHLLSKAENDDNGTDFPQVLQNNTRNSIKNKPKHHSRHCTFGSWYEFVAPTDQRRGGEISQTPRGVMPVSDNWQRLSKHIRSGNFLAPQQESQIISSPISLIKKSTASDNQEQPGQQQERHETATLDKGEMRSKAQEEIRNSLEFSVTQCCLAMAVYIAMAVLAYSLVLEPDWTVIDSMYFAVITFTTIGYGDLVPTTAVGRVFTAFFALSGVACLGIALGVLGSNLIEAERKAANTAQEISSHDAMTFFSSDEDNENNKKKEQTDGLNGYNDVENPITGSGFSDETETVTSSISGEQRNHEGGNFGESYRRSTGRNDVNGRVSPPDTAREKPNVSAILLGFGVLMAFFVFGLVLVMDCPAQGRCWDFGTALYYAIITLSTVGYGDYGPTSQMGRFLAVLLIPVGVGTMGHMLSVVATWIIDKRQKAFHDRLANFELSIEDLEIMDENNDGQVSEVEFLEFMLVAMNKVDKSTLDGLRGLFTRLDADGTGSLNKDDLIEHAKRKLKTSKRKLELAQYKQYLLEKAAEQTHQLQAKQQHQQQQQRNRRQRATSLVHFPMAAFSSADCSL